ncbi:hypothetical protein CK203_045796 [Vitis vinifera]|uniref:Retrotransposon gag domain-containing protein n=1 Tax=Vitis vinifera TaxID=29760 RepID=A0A438FM60_VITVI|nr:hypothetical protein CK203_045796 [Vitis vinifera]
MNHLHGSAPSLRRRAKGCIPSEGTIASTRDPLKSTSLLFKATLTLSIDMFALGLTSWIRVGGGLIRVSDQSNQRSDKRDMDSQITEVAPPPVIVPTPTLEDPHARMDRLEQRLRQLRTSDIVVTWEDFDGAPVASLSAKFRMPKIERYTGIGCSRIHLRLYSTIMRAHGLDEAQMIMLFPMSLSGEFLRQYALNTVVDISRRELEALRQRPEESVTSFISRWREKILQVIHRPSVRDQISMIMRSLQPQFARHLMGFLHTDFKSLVHALYGIEEGIARGLWYDSSPFDSKGKKPLRGQRSGDVNAINSIGLRPSRHYLTTYVLPALALPHYTTQDMERPLVSYSTATLPCYALRKLTEAGLLTALTPRPPPQPVPPQFRMDLHCAYHQGPGHETDRCTTLRHAI